MSQVKTALALLFVASGLGAQTGGELFPRPFRVEHHLLQTDADGGVFAGEPVTDTYGGSWIVSERGDSSRVVIDLARREITEIHPAKGAYWVVSFDRFAEMRSQLARFEAGFPAAEPPAAKAAAEEPAFTVSEGRGAPRSGISKAADAMLANPGVTHLRVELKGSDGEGMDVWCDPGVRLGPAALAALERFESDALGPPAWRRARQVPPARFLAAARRQARGAFPVRTARPIDLGLLGPEKAAPGRRGTVEDVVTRLETLERFPLELVQVPDGLERTAHPMEALLDFAEREEERERIMGRSVADEERGNR